MGYTARQAIATLDDYLGVNATSKQIIEETNGRGFVLSLSDKEPIVIFVYPLVHKKDNTKTYFDTRDSGALERAIAWNYAIEKKLKFFCIGVNDQVDKLKDYVFSLECSEAIVEKISGTLNGLRNGKGNQIIIRNNYIPHKNFDRIRSNLGIYISIIKKNELINYFNFFDNRPYMVEAATVDISKIKDYLDDENQESDTDSDKHKIQFKTGFQSSFSRNRILFGAPGTGKSYALNQDVKQLVKDGGRYERVTFHPDYSYANFVGTYKPVPFKRDDGMDGITYKYVPGPFSRILVDALKNAMSSEPAKPYVLIVEEINRANMAAVFGDVFQLLDRNADNISEYPIHASEDMKKYLAEKLGGKEDDYNEVRIPDNMFIWATMNSADQGVFPMDTAFKRRWDFTYFGINTNEKEIADINVVLGTGDYARSVSWNKLRKAINDKLLEVHINEDKLMGPFFISMNVLQTISEDNGEQFRQVFKDKVLMYLFEDVVRRDPSLLFGGCTNSRLYSEIVKEFDEKGVAIFHSSIRSQFVNQQNGNDGVVER